MLQITKQQIDARWDVTPVNLREILYSPEYGKIIWNIGEGNHLIDEKIGKIAGLVSYVIMGFIHPEDLAQEIKNSLGINLEIAASISRQIDRKIFSLIRSDIDKVYAPAGALAEEKLAEEIELPPAEISEEHIVDLRLKAEAEKPQMISLETLKTEAEKPKEEKKPIAAAAKEELKPLVPEIKTEDQPFILHKQEEIKPVLGEKKSLGGLFGFLGGKEIIKEEAKAPKPIAVEIQIGASAPELPKPPISPAPPAASRVELSKLAKPTPIIEKPKAETKKRIGFFKRITDFFKSLFIKKEIHYKEVEIPKNVEIPKPPAPSQPAILSIPKELLKFQAIQQKKIETLQPSKPPAPARVVHYTELRTPLKNEPAVSGEFIKIEHPPKYQPKPMSDQRPMTNDQRQIDLKKQSTQPIQPKLEIKPGEEMVDLRTLQKMTNNKQPMINDK